MCYLIGSLTRLAAPRTLCSACGCGYPICSGSLAQQLHIDGSSFWARETKYTAGRSGKDLNMVYTAAEAFELSAPTQSVSYLR